LLITYRGARLYAPIDLIPGINYFCAKEHSIAFLPRHCIPASDQTDPLMVPSWIIKEIRQEALTRISATSEPYNQRAKKFIEFLQSLPRSDIWVCRDL
ncbi:hypothetical protein GcC1_042031, partial [Golovinomyces cichoracearum]